jgi:predicted secreted protein
MLIPLIHRPLLAAALGAALAMSAGGAQAGDAAARRIVGFSPEGNYFAFEQYGQLDAGASASGWSEIDIIDTRTDQFVGGKPIRIVDESEEATLTIDQARKQAAAEAAPILARYAIAPRGDRRQIHLPGRDGRLQRHRAPGTGVAEMAVADL